MLLAKKILIVILLLATVGIFYLFIMTRYYANATKQIVVNLDKLSESQHRSCVNFDSLKNLPKPVCKYFINVLKDGQPFIKKAYLVQSGELTVNSQAKKWSSFKAEQNISALKPGFLWNAKISIFPLLHLRVLDSYIKGQARGEVFINSAINVASEEGNAKLNSGALYRYLAEGVWYPTALLPENGVIWTPVDNRRAIASITDSGITVSLEFTFNDAGEIIKIYTDKRYGLFEGEYHRYPWEGHFSNYVEKNGMRIPEQGKVGWHLPDGFWLFWKGKIEEVHYKYKE